MSIKLNGEIVDVTIFPDNTSQVWKLPKISEKEAIIVWEFQYEHEFMHLAQLKDLLDYYYIPTMLQLPYLPYARQDKPVSNETTFALHTFAKLLNSLNFKKINILDWHSDISHFLINNSSVTIPRDYICKILHRLNFNSFCFPDESAKNKYNDDFFKYCYGIKHRNQLTGEIIKHELVFPQEKGDNTWKVLIVDDIVDGGRTFISIAKLLQEQGITEINLYATHGIFSQGLKPLHDAGIKRIFTHKGEAFENRETKQIYYREIKC